jgi:hypothetical protein
MNITKETVRDFRKIQTLFLNFRLAIVFGFSAASWYYIHPVLCGIVLTHGLSHVREKWLASEAFAQVLTDQLNQKGAPNA